MVNDYVLRYVAEFVDNASARMIEMNSRMRKNSLNIQRMTLMDEKELAREAKLRVIPLKKQLVTEQASLSLKKMELRNLQMQSKEMKRFKMEYLGVIFAGMALQRVTVGFLRNIITTYNRAFEEQDGFRRATDRLVAAFTFLKFSIADALLNSEWFRTATDFIVGLLDRFNNFSMETKGNIALALGVTAVLATGLMIAGQTVLGIDSLSKVLTGQPATLATLGQLGGVLSLALTIGWVIKDIKAGEGMEALKHGLLGLGITALLWGQPYVAAGLIAASISIDIADMFWKLLVGEDDVANEILKSIAIKGLAVAIAALVFGHPVAAIITVSAVLTIILTSIAFKLWREKAKEAYEENVGGIQDIVSNFEPVSVALSNFIKLKTGESIIPEDYTPITSAQLSTWASQREKVILSPSDFITFKPESLFIPSTYTPVPQEILNKWQTQITSPFINAKKEAKSVFDLLPTEIIPAFTMLQTEGNNTNAIITTAFTDEKTGMTAAVNKFKDTVNVSINQSIIPDWNTFNTSITDSNQNVTTLNSSIQSIPDEIHKYLYYHIVTVEE